MPMLYDYTTATVETVRSEIESGLARAEENVARAVASASAPSFDATLQPLEEAAAEAGTAYGRSGFIGQVHVDSAVRDAGTEAEERLSKWRVALAFREDLYRAVRAFADRLTDCAVEVPRSSVASTGWLTAVAGSRLSRATRAAPAGSR